MKQGIARLIDDKAKRLSSLAVKRRNYAAIGGGVLTGFITIVALSCFNMPVGTVMTRIACTVFLLLASPYFLTYGGVFRVRRLIKQNRLVEARKLLQSLMATCLRLFPYSALYFASTLQMELMLRDAAYCEVEALSRLLREAIQGFPYSAFSKRRLLPLFDNFHGLAYLGLGDYEAARKMFAECLSMPSRRNKAVFLNNIGVCDLQLGKYEDAYAELTQAVAETPKALRENFVLSRIYPNLARVCLKLSKLDEASELIAMSSKYFEKNSEENTVRAGFYKVLGLLKAAEGHFDEAEQYLRSAVEMLHQVDELHPSLQESRLELAAVLDQLGKEKEAADLRKLVSENILKLQLRLENASDALLSSLHAGTHPIILMAK